MAKKYLLYIHTDRFAEEPKKSELVNQLLSEHYNEPDVYTHIKSKEPLLCPHYQPKGQCLTKGCKYGQGRA